MNNELFFIWSKRAVGLPIAALSLYLMVLDFLWGVWVSLRGSPSNLADSIVSLYHRAHFTGLFDALTYPLNAEDIWASGNYYFFTAYVVFIVSLLLFVSANSQAKERSELLREIRRERKKQGLRGEVPRQEYRERRAQSESGWWQQFNVWIWAPILAPLIVLAVAKFSGWD